MNKSNPRLVEVFDFESQTVKTMPKAELGPGMVQAYIQGKGTYWVAAHQAKQAPLRHPPFGPKLRGRLRKIMGQLKEVKPMTLKEWEDGFRRDTTPEREIAIWLKIADIYRDHALRRELMLEQKQELFNVILTCSHVSYDQVLNVMTLKSLPIEVARAAIESYFEKTYDKKGARMTNEEKYDSEPSVELAGEQLEKTGKRLAASWYQMAEQLLARGKQLLAQGERDGWDWAANRAEAVHLYLLDEARQIGVIPSPELPYDNASRQFFATIEPELFQSENFEAAHENFWKGITGKHNYQDPTYIWGFAEGAVKLWRRCRDRVYKGIEDEPMQRN